LTNERGSTLVVTMLILAILTIVSFALSNTSRTEIQIAANDQFYKMAFHNADTGINLTSKLFEAFLEENFDGTPLPSPDVFSYLPDEEAFREEALGLDLPAAGNVAIVQFVADDVHNIAAEVDFIRRQHTIGSEVNTSLSFIYNMETQGEGPRGSVSNIEAVYRHVEKI